MDKKMTDLEMTKLCAEAMGIHVAPAAGTNGDYFLVATSFGYPRYDPLHDDAQAMALVKKFKLQVLPNPAHGGWWIAVANKDANGNDDLNRAIVECVAKMQVDRTESVNRGTATLNKSLYG